MVVLRDGVIRYTISKSVLNEERLKRQSDFAASSPGRQLWTSENGRLGPSRRPFKLLHQGRLLGPR